MKKCIILVGMVLSILMISTSIPSVKADQSGWEITADPAFAFIGENITFSVTGLANVYFLFFIEDSNQTRLKDAFVGTNDQGVGTINFTVPMTWQSGIYIATVQIEQLNLTQCQFEVVYDELLYQKFLINKLIIQVNLLHNQTLANGRVANTAISNQEMNNWTSFIFGIVSTVSGLYVVAKFKRYWQWRMINMDRLHGPSWEKVMYIIDPPPRGDLRPYSTQMTSSVQSEFRKRLNEERGMAISEPMILYPNPEDPAGFSVDIARFVRIRKIKKDADGNSIIGHKEQDEVEEGEKQ
jgi:hypothetical protein